MGIGEVLDKQVKAVDNIIESFKGAQRALIEREIDKLSFYVVKVEEASLEFEKLEEEIIERAKKHGFNSVKEFIESEKDEEAFLKLSHLIEKLNALTITMESFKEMLDFENRYFEFLKMAYRGWEGTKTNYSKSGYSAKNSSVLNKTT
ncbi:hypothetical protein JYK00_01255 [Thermosipho ferrireducens]|uniref:Flagellar protein FlgN n=1 Tax=Thermosipho ferrireducens TaxID=2571116 RepID=A0ABX7S6J1_9BACT|nr:hypothetical protein [Thermosipho ferrireducens]QTA38197.1 hypothetical protein JYK00_01255 [Thermosipho ferrireducens]